MVAAENDGDDDICHLFHARLEDMYGRTPYQVTTIESYEMDCLLKCLLTPAHHALYTIHHALRHCQDMKTALLHCNHLVKPNHFLLYKESTDLSTVQSPSSIGDDGDFVIDNSLLEPGAYFDIVKELDKQEITKSGWSTIPKKQSITTKKLVQKLVSNQTPSRTLSILQELYRHLYASLGTDVREGTADVALTLSMIPILGKQECSVMNRIMGVLGHVAALELDRKRTKKRKAAEILMTLEKLGAAGCRGTYYQKVLSAAKNSLPGALNFELVPTDTFDNLMQFNFWSPRSLLWLWRRLHVFHKVSAEDSQKALTVQDLISNPPPFDDPSKPLVVDVGCGLGVTLIGLAAAERTNDSQKYQLDLNWSDYNYLGSDLSSKAMDWASSLTMRLGLSERCQFVHASTETVLKYLQSQSETSVKLLLLQFPTPYRLQGKGGKGEDDGKGCNTKLPLSPDDPSFMANPSILRQMVQVLNHNQQGQRTAEPYLLLQSNCEDVSLQIHDELACKRLQAVPAQTPRNSFDGLSPSSRTKAWLEIGTEKRAMGPQWSSKPVIPIQTETEVSSEYQSTPVHRCLFKTSSLIDY